MIYLTSAHVLNLKEFSLCQEMPTFETHSSLCIFVRSFEHYETLLKKFLSCLKESVHEERENKTNKALYK